MSDFSQLVKSIFSNKLEYDKIDDKKKKSVAYAFNRYMARAFPEHADLLNNVDPLCCLDIWYNFAKKRTKIPDWFYNNRPMNFNNKEKEFDEVDMYILENYFKDELKEYYNNRKPDILVKKLKRKK